MSHGEVASGPSTEGAEPSSLHLVAPSEGVAVWSAVVAAAEEACLVLDAGGHIASVSESAAQLLAGALPEQLVGRTLGAGPVHLVDFTRELRPLSEPESCRTPMIAALRTGSLARGLIRVRLPHGSATTLDVVAAPLISGGQVVGSLSYFSAV